MADNYIKEGEFSFTGNDTFCVNNQIKKTFDEQGFILVRGLLTPEELEKVRGEVERSDGVQKHAYKLEDGGSEGRFSKLSLWSYPGDDVLGMLARSHKMATTSEKLLGGEGWHYASKLLMKEPRTGGQFVWHQDYGYWYQNGFLFPHMLTAFLALDKADRDNGCLQIIPGSHVAGLVDHGFVGGQQGADPMRVKELLNVRPLKYVEMEAGDCLFFHSNVVHRSDANMSSRRRWVLASAYCRADNQAVMEHYMPPYTPLHVVPNSAIMACTSGPDLEGKHFIDPKADHTVVYDEAKQK